MGPLTRLERTTQRSQRAATERVLRWTRGRRAALGIGALVMLVSALGPLVSEDAWRPIAPALRLGVGIGLAVFDVVLAIGFAILALENPRLDRRRGSWLLALLVAPPLAAPLYWWLHVWHAPQHEDDARGER